MTAATQTAQHRFTLPRIFWTDHFERCAEHPGVRVVVKETANRVTVDLDAAALADFISDARHYANDGVDPDGIRHICRSARAALRALGCV
jgi:hypothetical protein